MSEWINKQLQRERLIKRRDQGGSPRARTWFGRIFRAGSKPSTDYCSFWDVLVLDENGNDIDLLSDYPDAGAPVYPFAANVMATTGASTGNVVVLVLDTSTHGTPAGYEDRGESAEYHVVRMYEGGIILGSSFGAFSEDLQGFFQGPRDLGHCFLSE